MSKKKVKKSLVETKEDEPVRVDEADFEAAFISYAGYIEENGKLYLWTEAKVKESVKEVEEYYAASYGEVKCQMRHYNLARVYDVVRKNSKSLLIKKSDKDKDACPIIIPFTDYHSILCSTHFRSAHGGRDRIRVMLKNEYLGDI